MVGVVGTSVFEGATAEDALVGCELLASRAGPYGIIIAAVILYICLAWKYPDMVLPLIEKEVFVSELMWCSIQTILKENPSIKDQDLFLQAALLLLELAKNDKFQKELYDAMRKGKNIDDVFNKYAPGGLRDPGEGWDKVGQCLREAFNNLKLAIKNRDSKAIIMTSAAIVASLTMVGCILADAAIKPIWDALEKINKEEEKSRPKNNNTTITSRG
ncbi:hypothetical protein [Methanothermobacter thermautotrophicus]|nr:hypothetical protein [Methanothermobacter thermautotrophicus]